MIELYDILMNARWYNAIWILILLSIFTRVLYNVIFYKDKD